AATAAPRFPSTQHQAPRPGQREVWSELPSNLSRAMLELSSREGAAPLGPGGQMRRIPIPQAAATRGADPRYDTDGGPELVRSMPGFPIALPAMRRLWRPGPARADWLCRLR